MSNKNLKFYLLKWEKFYSTYFFIASDVFKIFQMSRLLAISSRIFEVSDTQSKLASFIITIHEIALMSLWVIYINFIHMIVPRLFILNA